MQQTLPPIALDRPSIRSTLDRRFWLFAILGAFASLIVLGVVSAIIPNPVFARMIPPDGPAIAVWIASAPLMGALLAAYLAPPRTARRDSVPPAPGPDLGGRGFTIGGLATVFAIGCPVCNKIVLLTLGTTGALNVWAPIQPLIGVASLVVLAFALRATLRRRAEGCTVPYVAH